MQNRWFSMGAACVGVFWALYAIKPLMDGKRLEWLVMLALSAIWMVLAFASAER